MYGSDKDDDGGYFQEGLDGFLGNSNAKWVLKSV